MDTSIKLYRKRYIPNETNYLKDDLILYQDDSLLITKWNCLKPRKDISRGISAYCLDKGYKICKVYNTENEIVYWYCDIIESSMDEENNSLIVTDLLIDVLVYESGFVKVVDLDELAEATEQGLITSEQACQSLRIANTLLEEIYNGNFAKYKALIDQYC